MGAVSGYELWRSDGTSTGTVLARKFGISGTQVVKPGVAPLVSMAVIGSTLYFEDYSPLSVASSVADQFVDHSGWYLWSYTPSAIGQSFATSTSTSASDWQLLGADATSAGVLANLVAAGNEADALTALINEAMAENISDTQTVKKTVVRAKPKPQPVETVTATPTPAPVVSVPVPVETKTAAAVPETKSGFNSKLIILIVVIGLALGLGITFVGRREPKRKLYR